MPYEIRGKCIYRSDTGKKVGCTKGDVKKYLAALHMNVKEGNENMKLTEIYKNFINESNLSAEDRALVNLNAGDVVELTWKDYGPVYYMRLDGEFNTGDIKGNARMQEVDPNKNFKKMGRPTALMATGAKIKRIKSSMEESYKLSKGNKSTKNVFGEDELKTPWATGKKDDCCKDYGITYEEAEKKLKEIKSHQKLDEEYQNLVLQMTNSFDRNRFRICYNELRNKIGKYEIPKNKETKNNFEK